MSVYDKKIFVFGGNLGNELCSGDDSVYVLDTSKFSIPSDPDPDPRESGFHQQSKAQTERTFSGRSTQSTSASSGSTGQQIESTLTNIDRIPSDRRRKSIDREFEIILREEEDSAVLLQFLRIECAALAQRFKVRFGSNIETVHDSHWTTDNNSEIICQGRIDSGAAGDVYQV
jgi:hypothetical protein